MFGYVRPLKCELKMREWELYQAAYCGLCHALKRRCGFAARFTVNYDFTFLALILSAIHGEAMTVENKRCVASPVKKKKICSQNSALDFAADASVILVYWKLIDEVNDLDFFSGLPARAASFMLKRAYRRGVKKYPQFSAHVQACLKELSDIEKKRMPSLDAPADTFARILERLAEEINSEKDKRIAGQMFYHLGRYIYLIDAWDDLADDLKSGAYNPIAERFRVENMPISLEVKEEMKETLAQSIKAVINAFELLDVCECDGLIRNILTLGLPAMVGLVEKGELNKKEKILNERSV